MLATLKTDNVSSIVELRLEKLHYGATSDAHGVDRLVDAIPHKVIWRVLRDTCGMTGDKVWLLDALLQCKRPRLPMTHHIVDIAT